MSSLKKFFLNINDRRKLNIVLYNKKIQNKLNINIIDVRYYSGKYKINGINGKGKEYTLFDDLIFEGEYLNGKRNGKGKEYGSNKNLIF